MTYMNGFSTSLKRMLLSVAFLFAVFSASVGGVNVRSWPAPIIRTANVFQVSVNGKPVEAVTVPTPDHCLSGADARPYQAAFFEADDEVEVVVSGVEMRDARVLPLSAGIKAKNDGKNRMSFRAKPPFTLAVEPTGRHHALILVANMIEDDAPKPGEPGVVYIGPGTHHRDEVLELKSGETLYLAPGAYLESAIVAKGTNIVVRGHGILSGACWAHERGPKKGHVMAAFTGKDITIRDVTLMSSYNWTLVLNKCEDVLVDNVRILNGRVLNDDGIDVCRSRRVTIRNCFIRSQDDCITPKFWCEDLLVERCALWTDVANIFRIGYECDGTGKVYRNLTFRDIDILHQSIRKKPASEYWAENAIFIQPGNDQEFVNFRFERIRFDSPEAGDRLLTIRTFKVNDNWQHHKEAGHFRGLVMQDVHVPSPLAADTMGVWLESHDSNHRVDDVRFENTSGIGPLTVVGDVRDVAIPADAFAPAAEPVTNWTSGAGRNWHVIRGGVSVDGENVSVEAVSSSVTNGVFTAVVCPETPPKGAVAATLGLRVAGAEGSWSLALYQKKSKKLRYDGRTYDFSHHFGKQAWAPKGSVCLYSRKGGPWEYGRPYRFSIRLDDRFVEATIIDEDGFEMFAEAWQFGRIQTVKSGCPQVFTWNGVGGTFKNVGVITPKKSIGDLNQTKRNAP